jgi:hypothetical protein
LIQSSTSLGLNLLPRTPNRWDLSRPRKYARRTVSSWHPTNAATSHVAIKRLGNFPYGTAISLPALTSQCMELFWPYFFMTYLLHREARSDLGQIGTKALAVQETSSEFAHERCWLITGLS